MRDVIASAALPLAGSGRAATASLVAGLSVLAILWLGPLVPMSRTAFSPHMLLHLGVVVVVSPLISYALARRLPSPNGFRAALSWCLLAAAFEMVAVWGWHIPRLHDAAGHNAELFILEQASFLIAGLAVWTAAFAGRSRSTAGAAAIALFFTFTHMTMFGLVLTLAPRLVYDPSLCLGAFGLDRLNDQHFGGALMAIGGGLPYLAATGWTIFVLLRERRQFLSTGRLP
jgi:putative membrane protein